MPLATTVDAGNLGNRLKAYSSLDVHVKAGDRLYRVTGLHTEFEVGYGLRLLLDLEAVPAEEPKA